MIEFRKDFENDGISRQYESVIDNGGTKSMQATQNFRIGILVFDPEIDEAQFLELDKGTYREASTDSELVLDNSGRISLDVDAIF